GRGAPEARRPVRGGRAAGRDPREPAPCRDRWAADGRRSRFRAGLRRASCRRAADSRGRRAKAGGVGSGAPHRRLSDRRARGVRRMKPVARIVQLGAAFLCSNLARAAIGFGLTVAIGRGLGVDRFGTWILSTTWASTLTTVADLGFGVLLTRDG